MANSDSVATSAQQSAATVPTTNEHRFQINTLPFGIMKKLLVITPQAVTYGNKVLETEAITGITTQIIRSSTNGIRTNTEYTLSLGSMTSGYAQTIKLTDIFYGSSKGKIFNQIMDAIMTHAGMSLLTRLVARIQSGGDVVIGTSVWRKDGVTLTPTKMLVFKGDPILVPYERLQMSMSDGSIELFDCENKNANVEFPMGGTNNSYMVEHLFEYLVTKQGWRDFAS